MLIVMRWLHSFHYHCKTFQKFPRSFLLSSPMMLHADRQQAERRVQSAVSWEWFFPSKSPIFSTPQNWWGMTWKFLSKQDQSIDDRSIPSKIRSLYFENQRQRQPSPTFHLTLPSFFVIKRIKMWLVFIYSTWCGLADCIICLFLSRST